MLVLGYSGRMAAESSAGAIAEECRCGRRWISLSDLHEDLNVVKNSIYASLGIDWPKDKLNIRIL
ncbi:hypothetical protein ACNKHP_12015 [Shigella boydii]